MTLVVATALLLAQTIVRADDINGLGTLGGSLSAGTSLSADGTVAAGYSQVTGDTAIHAFRWSGGAMLDLGSLGGGNSYANGISADGAVVTGYAYVAVGQFHAFRWSGGIMSDLGTLAGGNNSIGYAASADGSVVVGVSDIPGGGRAFRWSGGVMSNLGTLGGSISSAYAVSADGAVVVGDSYVTGNSTIHAFRWSGGVMSDLGTLGGVGSSARSVSADGLVVVGFSTTTGNPADHAFRWSGGVMTDLGVLAGGTTSLANAVSASGAVVVGQSESAAAPGGEAIRWIASTGMQSIKGLLAAGGVNMTGWSLDNARGVSADGSVIVGVGTNPSAQLEAWIVRLSSGLGSGFITTSVAAQSFAGQSAVGQTANTAIGNGLGSMTEVATQSIAKQGLGYSVYALGGYDSDPAASGTLGITFGLPNDMRAGVAVSANHVWTNTVYDGNAKLTGGSAGAFLARAPEMGWQWLAGVTAMTLQGDLKRGYLNGVGLSASEGSTNAIGYGFTGRIGYAFDHVLPKTGLTPFASYTYTSTHFDGYTETSGPFPAQFAAYTTSTQTSRLGADARYTLSPGKWLWGTLAWAHRLDGAKGTDISGTLIGLFSMTSTGASTAQDWVELTGGVRVPAWKKGALTASLTASIPAAYAATYAARIGVTQAF